MFSTTELLAISVEELSDTDILLVNKQVTGSKEGLGGGEGRRVWSFWTVLGVPVLLVFRLSLML